MADTTNPSQERRRSSVKEKFAKFVHGEKQQSPEDERPHNFGLQDPSNADPKQAALKNPEDVVGRGDKGLAEGVDRFVDGERSGSIAGTKVGQV